MTLARVDQSTIAERLGVDQSTISRDLAALREQWAREAGATLDEHRSRELAELNDMENQAALEYARARSTEWLQARLNLKKRRAALLGLDAPQRHTASVQAEVAVEGTVEARLTDNPEYRALRRRLLEALQGFPEARQAVADAFAGKKADDG